jgi:CDP-glucose 4,6-dehydratase
MESMGVNPFFWQGRRVFLTGHTGFKGGWLSLWLQQLGAEVVGYALPPSTEPNLYAIARVEEGLQSVMGDVRDFEAVRAAMAAAQPEIVIHMAAQALVRYSYDHPVETYAVNVLGTVHVLEAARQTDSVRALVNVTSDKCYENREWLWGYRENEAMGGFDPYSSSKGCAELVTSAYRRSFMEASGIGLASARAGNVIGGGDWATDRLIPDILRAIGQNEPAHIRAPLAIRPWQHVLEPLSGYLLLAERLHADGLRWADGWNFGPAEEDARPVGWIADELTRLWGGDALWERDAAIQPHEATHLRLDCSKARSQLNWHSRWSLADALSSIVDWHKAYLAGADMRERTLYQIQQYCHGDHKDD